MKTILFSLSILLFLASCQAKTEQAEDATLSSAVTSVADVQTDGYQKLTKGSIARLANDTAKEDPDSLAVEEYEIECYVWANTYKATTIVETEEGDQFELHIDITLKDFDFDDYVGTINMYLSGCEDQMFRGTIKAKAQRNYVTVFFNENVEGMEDLFKKGDKLVQFEISYGEYIASWFAPMFDYVDEYTVLSLENK